MNRWTKIAAACVAVMALTGVTISIDGGFMSMGRTWADGPAASSTALAR